MEIIGDAYFAVAGCPVSCGDHAARAVRASLGYLSTLPRLREMAQSTAFEIRVGVHTGPCVAGVVGIKDPRYHVFGDTATIANSMESHGQPGRVHISQVTYQALQRSANPSEFVFEDAGIQSYGPHGMLQSYFVTAADPSTAGACKIEEAP